MDERLKGYKIGRPIPEQDMARRLDIDRHVAPTVMDFATIYRINATFMDVTDQPYLRRHIVALVSIIAFSGFILGLYIWLLPGLLDRPLIESARASLRLIGFACIVVFAPLAIWCGKGELFALSRRPIRFNRRLRKIYAVRRRRFFGASKNGDVVWEIPWSAETVFCLCSRRDGWGDYYHIVCYQIDADRNVMRAFAIGRRWESHELNSLLGQWNYWCAYMNQGPDKLPKPMLYLAEKEGWIDSFFICMYTFGFSLSAVTRLITMPLILPLYICRRLSLATCRQPIWPGELNQLNETSIAEFNEPQGVTPVGWKSTIDARLRGEWPSNPYIEVANWSGLDARMNAQHWANK